MLDPLVRLALRARAYPAATALERAIRAIPAVDRLAKRAYAAHKRRRLVAVTSDAGIRAAMLGERPLPVPYGRGMDERIVEYPWVLARVPAGPGRVLDAGSTLNFPWVADHPRVAERDVVLYTLAPEGTLDRPRYAYLYGDLRRTPFRRASMDLVVSISTLEHIGMDNTGYTGAARDTVRDRYGYRSAMAELGRVLRPGGRLLLTVPYGARRDLGWLQQFDAEGLADLLEHFPGSLEALDHFRHHPGRGWSRAAAADCADAEYVHVEASSGATATMATAVACAALVRAGDGP